MKFQGSSVSESNSTDDLLGITAEIVAAHVSNNSVAVADLPSLIKDVHRTLAMLGSVSAAPETTEVRPPAVPVKKSVTPDYIICLEDGKKLKMLKRHLSAAYGMTPDQYRDKWGSGVSVPPSA